MVTAVKSQDKRRCPECGRLDTYYIKSTGMLHCRVCGTEWVPKK